MRVTNHVNRYTVGNLAQQSSGPVEIARNHRERTLENSKLVWENAELRSETEAEMEKMQAEMQAMREAMVRGAPLVQARRHI